MWKRVTLPLEGIFLYLSFCIPFWFFLIDAVDCLPASAVLVDADPLEVRRVIYNQNPAFKHRRAPDYFLHLPHSEYYDDQESLFSDEDSFYMGPEDAVTGHKYSPPIVDHQPQQPHRHFKEHFVPSHIFTQPQNVPTFSSVSGDQSIIRRSNTAAGGSNKVSSTSTTQSVFREVTVTSDYKVASDVQFHSDNNRPLIERKQRRSDSAIQPHLLQNNFTDVNDSHDVVPSDAILQYQPHPVIPNNNETPKDTKGKNTNVSAVYDVPISSSESSSTTQETLESVDANAIPKKDIQTDLKTEAAVDFLDLNLTTDRTVYYLENQTFSSNPPETTQNVSVSPPVKSTKLATLSSGIVAAIVIGVLTCVTLLTSSVIYLLYRRYNGKCTGVAEGKFNSDNCGYLDDSLRSSVYLNNHIELPKENSEEMTSLDNDSFLNSLETMTIQNYWADNTKNTKV